MKIMQVAPFTGAWIEISSGYLQFAVVLASLPSRERGLKLFNGLGRVMNPDVAPFTGAWIEMSNAAPPWRRRCVAPFTGAWIEML